MSSSGKGRIVQSESVGTRTDRDLEDVDVTGGMIIEWVQVGG